MKKEKVTWINEKGNLCFFWDGDKGKGILTFCTIILIILSASVFIDYFWITGVSVIILFGVLATTFIGYNYAMHNSKQKDAFLLSLIKDKLDEQIVSYTSKKEQDIQEKRRCIFYQTKGTYGQILGTFVLCMLSDKNVIEFELVYHIIDDKGYYELTNEPHVCKEEERLKAIIPFYTIKKIAKDLTISIETKLRLIVISILTVSTLIAILGFLAFTYFDIRVIILSLIGYFIFMHIWNILVGKFKTTKTITWIINIPAVIFGLFVELGHPAIVIYGAIAFPIIFISGIILIFLKILDFLGINITYHTQLFIMLTTTEIICVHIPCITKWFIKNSPLKNWENHKYEAYKEQLGLYVTSPKNYNFLFSFLYTLFLTANAYCQLEFHTFLISTEWDNAILKSFLVFLAFSAMMQKSKETEINSQDLYTKIKGLFLHDEDENCKKA